MKSKIITIALLLLSFSASSQDKNKISGLYSFANSDFGAYTAIDGWGQYKRKDTKIFGINYQRNLKGNLYLESGFEYSFNKFDLYPTPDPTINQNPREINIKMLSIPVFLNYSGKYFFINGGPLFDYEIDRENYASNANQTGIGFELGIGVKYSLNKIEISINTFMTLHSIVPFEKEKYHQHLSEGGIKLGIGYSF